MHDADIYLFTSDYGEGWGCVLNEAMSEGNAVIASSMAGATTFLVKDNENGMIYDGSSEQLYSSLKRLMRSPKLIREFGEAARATIEEKWNGDEACRNLMMQYEKIMKDGCLEIIDGPCGKYAEGGE